MGFEQRHTAITSAKAEHKIPSEKPPIAGGVSQQILQGKPAEDEEPPGWRGRKKCEGLRNSWELVLPAKRIPDIDPDQKIRERGAPMIRWGPGWVRSEKKPQARQ